MQPCAIAVQIKSGSLHTAAHVQTQPGAFAVPATVVVLGAAP